MVRRSAHPGRLAKGFTLIELLVVISIIALLIAIGGAAYFGLANRSQRAATEQYLTTVKTAIEAFKLDHGYYPPLIDDDPSLGAERFVPEAQPGLGSGSNRDPIRSLEEARYYSVHSLALYLIGIGDLSPNLNNPDAYEHDGVPGPGFRSPGSDKSWGGAISRTTATHRPPRDGRTYGPYVDVSSGREIRPTESGDMIARYQTKTFPTNNERVFYTLVDRWNNPIRYYRYWPTGTVDNDGRRERSFNETPIELLSQATITQAIQDAKANQLPEFTLEHDRDLFGAEYALVSAGPDLEFASAGADTAGVPEGMFEESIPDGFDFASEFFKLDELQQRAIEASIADNIRVLP